MVGGLSSGEGRPAGRGRRPISVLKIGGSILTGPRGFRTAAGEVRREVEHGHRVVAVVSALRGATDELWCFAHAVVRRPDPRHLASLLATGEEASVALLATALVQEHVHARAVLRVELGLLTEGPILDARPSSVDVTRLGHWLRGHETVVVPGFTGRTRGGSTSVLGRGGSDLTALFLAHALDAAECRLIKDVDGLYPRDPNGSAGTPDPGPGVASRSRASFQEVARLGGGLVQDKALEFARAHALRFRIAAPGSTGTEVGPDPPSPTTSGRDCPA